MAEPLYLGVDAGVDPHAFTNYSFNITSIVGAGGTFKLRFAEVDKRTELTIKLAKRGARLYEVPISYSGRTYAEGKKISWRDGFPALLALIKYRFRD